MCVLNARGNYTSIVLQFNSVELNIDGADTIKDFNCVINRGEHNNVVLK